MNNYRELVDLIDKSSPVRDLSKQNTVLVSHAWHLYGSSSLVKMDSKEVVSILKLEGASSSHWFHQMGKNFDAFNMLHPLAPLLFLKRQ